MQDTFEQLREIYGSHRAVAHELGITRRAYQNYRTKGRIPEPMKKLIDHILKSAKEDRANLETGRTHAQAVDG